MTSCRRTKAALLALALPLLNGCGVGWLPDAGSIPLRDAAPSIRLTLADSWTTTSTAAVDAVSRKLIDRFRAENPSVELIEDVLDNSSLKTKIKTLAAGNALPDVFMMIGSDARMLLEDGLILPMNGMLDEDPAWKRGFRPEAFDDFTIDGAIAGIPMQMTVTSIVYYNEDIFRKAGFDQFPQTWDRFIDAVRKIKALGYTPIEMGNKDQWVAVSSLLSVVGDRMTGSDWFASIERRSGARFTDPSFVEALSAIKQLADAGAFNADLNNLDNIQQRTAYYMGQAAMFLEGGWAVSSVSADAPKPILDRTHLALLPVFENGKGRPFASSGGSGWALAVSANLPEEKRKAAMKLVKLLTGDAAANMKAQRGDISGSLPTDFDYSATSALFREYLALLEKLTITPVYDVRLSPEIVPAINRGLQALLTQGSGMTPETLAGQIQEAYERE